MSRLVPCTHPYADDNGRCGVCDELVAAPTLGPLAQVQRIANAPDASASVLTGEDWSGAALARWLRKQYARYNEIEDKLAADELDRLARELAVLRNSVRPLQQEVVDAKAGLARAREVMQSALQTQRDSSEDHIYERIRDEFDAFLARAGGKIAKC